MKNDETHNLSYQKFCTRHNGDSLRIGVRVHFVISLRNCFRLSFEE